MYARLSQLTRHLSRPVANYAHSSAAATARSGLGAGSMTSPSLSAAEERNRRTIHTAGCIMIGDEILNGKTVDSNSAYFAKFCFSLGINLKRIEVIADEESEIIEATRRMSETLDLVVCSGGIGPTHDDITYASIAKGFGLQLRLHEAALERMRRLSKPHPSQPDFSWDVDSAARQAKYRMIELPTDEARSGEEQALFVSDDLWVPISVVNGNVHILPGVPRLFERLLDGLKPLLLPRVTEPEGGGICRILVSTPLAESAVAGYLTELAGKVEARGVKVGSYPRWGKRHNTVTLVGRDREYMEGLVAEVERGVQGHRVEIEGEDDSEGEGNAKP